MHYALRYDYSYIYVLCHMWVLAFNLMHVLLHKFMNVFVAYDLMQFYIIYQQLMHIVNLII